MEQLAPLDEQQKLDFLEAFVDNADIAEIAIKMDIPKEILISALNDPDLIKDAYKQKMVSTSLRVLSRGVDRLMEIIDTGEPNQAIAAFSKLTKLLGLEQVVKRDSSGNTVIINLGYEQLLEGKNEKDVVG